jgi:uncharacterized protein DUF1573
MTKQLSTRRNLKTLLSRSGRGVGLGWFFCLILAACGSENPDPNRSTGLVFSNRLQALGVLTSGEVREVVFPFTVGGQSVTVHNFETSCGCLNVRILIGGEVHPLGQEIAPGSRGELRVEWRTAGFEGLRKSTIRVLGVGPGLPATLNFSAELEPWFRIESGPVFQMGEFDGEIKQTFEVKVSAPEPFRLLDILAGLAPLKLAGLPSGQAATEQVFQIVIPAGEAEEGQHTGFLQFRTDQEYALTVPVDFTVARELWVKPAKRLLLGSIQSQQPSQAVLEVGARLGRLEKPVATLQGIPNASIVVVTLEDYKRYQLRVNVPSGLASGPVKGTIHLQLRHLLQGQERTVERVLQLLGVVTDGR